MIMIALLITISVISAAFSGIAKAICDLSEEGKLFMFDKDLNLFFWRKSYSWKNKWKLSENREPIIENGKYVERFWGSSRWFVSFTDAWHLFGFVFRVSYGIAFLAIGSLALYNPLLPLLAIPAYALFAGVFHIFHTYKILRK